MFLKNVILKNLNAKKLFFVFQTWPHLQSKQKTHKWQTISTDCSKSTQACEIWSENWRYTQSSSPNTYNYNKPTYVSDGLHELQVIPNLPPLHNAQGHDQGYHAASGLHGGMSRDRRIATVLQSNGPKRPNNVKDMFGQTSATVTHPNMTVYS